MLDKIFEARMLRRFFEPNTFVYALVLIGAHESYGCLSEELSLWCLLYSVAMVFYL